MYKRDERYLFNPTLRFKKEKHRCIAYQIDEFFFAPDHLTILHPNELIFLMLFDGTRTFEQVEKDFDYLFSDVTNNKMKISADKTISVLEKRMGLNDVLVPVVELSQHKIKDTVNRYNPKDFLIDSNLLKIDYDNLRLDAPLSVNFNVMTRCNFKCLYCYHPLTPVNDLISVDRLKVLFKEFKETGCESVLLTGGDPMLRPDIDEIMKALYKTNLFYTLSTKSIINKDRLDKLYNEAGLGRMQLSLDSSNQETLTRLIGVRASYLKGFIQMVRNMQKIGMAVRLKAVLTSFNAWEMNDYLQFVSDLGVKHVQIVGYGRSGFRHNDIYYPSEEQQKYASEVVESWKRKSPEMEIIGGNYSKAFDEPVPLETNMFAKRSICNAGRFAMTLLPNGEVSVCEHLPYDKRTVIGDLRTQGVLECWNGQKMTEWLSPPKRNIFPSDSPCAKCKEDDYNLCHTKYSRCLRFIREITGFIDGPDIKCPYAQFKKMRIS